MKINYIYFVTEYKIEVMNVLRFIEIKIQVNLILYSFILILYIK